MRLPSAAEIERHVLSLPQVAAGVDRIADEVLAEAQQLAIERATDQGDYFRSIHRRHEPGPAQSIVADDEKATILERGTGVFGPKKRPIRPVKGKFLVFKIGDETIFARSVKGRPASHVMRDASERVARSLGLRWHNRSGLD